MSIKLEEVSYTYMPGTPYEQTALDHISLEIEKGEFLAIIGHTGSGKSTLVQQEMWDSKILYTKRPATPTMI